MHYTATIFNKSNKVLWTDTFYSVERAAEVSGAKVRNLQRDELLINLVDEFFIVIEPCWNKTK